jgi:alkylation response protein AidB-like acyl-CoA dehydrogenase
LLTLPIPAAIPEEDEALRAPVRAFLQEALAEMSPERRARSWMGYDLAFSRALAGRGWIGLTLPTRYGGGGRSPFARFVVIEELLAAGAPVGAHWIAERQTAPLILRYGTEAQRARFIPAICRGEIQFCIGMSEPDSGSDLASVRSRAERTDSGWRLTGQKIWTTFGDKAPFMIALVRTGGATADRHAGLSQLLIDFSLPGIATRPIVDAAGDAHFAQIFFDDVILPADALIGEEGKGWEQVNAELTFERSGPERYLSCTVLIDEWMRFLRSQTEPAASDIELLGRFLAEASALRSLSLSVTGALARGEDPATHAAIVKDAGTSFEQSVPRLIADRLASSDATVPAALLATLAYLAAMSPAFSLRGGTREIIRGIIARGLGLR